MTEAGLLVDLITPESVLYTAAAEMVVVPGIEGDFAVLVQHAPFVSLIRPGVVSVYKSGTSIPTKRFFVAGGVAQATGPRCILLIEQARDIEQVSLLEAEEGLKSTVSVKDSEDPRLRGRYEEALALLEAVKSAS